MYRRKTDSHFKPKIYQNELNQNTLSFNNLNHLQKSVDNLNIFSDSKTKTPRTKATKVNNDYYTVTAPLKININSRFPMVISNDLNINALNKVIENNIKKLNHKKINNIETDSSEKSKTNFSTALHSLQKNTDNSKNESYNGLDKINCSNEINSVTKTAKKLGKKNLASEFNKIYNKDKESFKENINVKKKILGIDLKMRDVNLIKDKMKEEILSDKYKIKNTKIKYTKILDKNNTHQNIIKIIDEQKICVLSKINNNAVKTSRNLENQYSKILNEEEAEKKVEEDLNKNYQVSLSYRGLDLMKKIKYSVEKKYKMSRTTTNKWNKDKKLEFKKKKITK